MFLDSIKLLILTNCSLSNSARAVLMYPNLTTLLSCFTFPVKMVQPKPCSIALFDIYKKKFDAELTKPEKAGEPWTCLAKKTMVPELKAMQKIRQQFVTIATANGGEYHGWSAIPGK
jgi:hypothetical protein